MKTLKLFMCAGAALLLTSCGGSSAYLESAAPEEGSLNLVKVTDESNNTVVSPTVASYFYWNNAANSTCGINRKKSIAWYTQGLLDISPDGKKLAYVTRMNRQDNVMIRSVGTQGLATQRTFRNVGSFTWGKDNKLYFSDVNGSNAFICSVNAEQGSMMSQLTNGNVWDYAPAVTADGQKLFFTRTANSGPSIWSLDRKDGTLTSCTRGYNPCIIPGNPNAIYCVRNNTSGRSEIWYVDFVKGVETLVASDENHGFSNPRLSPDGQWLVMVGNATSSINKKENLDIFAVRTDGSGLTQLTFHPDNDTCPVFAADGRSIFFISSRANKDKYYNVWRMNFNLE
ncbi:MAG: PD40 domain-containing protein [Alloprevotella sp.]